ncbi:MAG: hypothetical protein VKN13_00370 [Cyanobacteriota bacterium]|nr:hypothetical protein [Cyanobacteriota bacterium]
MNRSLPCGPSPGGGATPWALSWGDDGELAAQDRFDVLQALIASESAVVQVALVCAIERLPNHELSVMTSSQVSGLCA